VTYGISYGGSVFFRQHRAAVEHGAVNVGSYQLYWRKWQINSPLPRYERFVSRY
jgi:hypothetical protein